MGFENIACCYHPLTAYLIQYLLLGIGITGIVFNILGFILIYWNYVSGFIEFLYMMCFIFNIISTGCILLLIYYRRNRTINQEKNKISIKISFANIIISIVGFIFGAICLVYISIKYYDHETDLNPTGKKIINGWDKFFMFLILGVNLRIFMFLFFWWISILIRLLKKTSGAYLDDKKIEMNISTVSNTNDEAVENKNNSHIESGNKNITREVKVMYGTRELNLK